MQLLGLPTRECRTFIESYDPKTATPEEQVKLEECLKQYPPDGRVGPEPFFALVALFVVVALIIWWFKR